MAFRNLPDLWRGGTLSPFREMSRLQRRIDRVFDEFFTEPLSSQEFVPACDIEESETNFLVSFDLPGVKKDEVKIEVRDNMLTVSGERKSERKEEEKGRFTSERYYGAFCRSFMLPSNVTAEKIEASFDSGVLQITVPKAAATKGTQIPVKEGKRLEGKAGKAA